MIGVLMAQNNGTSNLSEHLRAFDSFIGKIYEGEFANSTPENPVIDIQKWESILNGNAIRILHSVNKGEYGGEVIITWDSEQNSLISNYFTSAGFNTKAIMYFEDGKLISIEEVSGNQNGITKVKAIIKFLPQGGFINSSVYYQNNIWVDGHQVHYKESPKSTINFKVVPY